MASIPGGAFRMGSEDFYPEERPVHDVSVDGFWMDCYVVQQPTTEIRLDPCSRWQGFRWRLVEACRRQGRQGYSAVGETGTIAWIVVPRLGCESIESVPFTSLSRSSMLTRPSPRLSLVASSSKPEPESRIMR